MLFLACLLFGRVYQPYLWDIGEGKSFPTDASHPVADMADGFTATAWFNLDGKVRPTLLLSRLCIACPFCLFACFIASPHTLNHYCYSVRELQTARPLSVPRCTKLYPHSKVTCVFRWRWCIPCL